MKKILVLLVFLLVLPFAVQAKKADLPAGLAKQAHAPGTNIVSPEGAMWLISDTYERRLYVSLPAFNSYAFNSPSGVISANKADLRLPIGEPIFPREGKLFISNIGVDSGTAYIITNYQKAPFSSIQILVDSGFSPANEISVGSSTLGTIPTAPTISDPTAKHPKGVLINNGGTVQYMGTSGLYGIPDLATFYSWGYSFNEVVPSNAADRALVQIGVLSSRHPGELNPDVE